MIVESSQVVMAGASEQFSLKSTRTTTGVETATVSQWLNELSAEDLGLVPAEESVQVDISSDGKKAAAKNAVSTGAVADWSSMLSDMEDVRMQLLRTLMKMFTGKDVPIKALDKMIKTPKFQNGERIMQTAGRTGDTQMTGRLTNGLTITGNQSELMKRKLKLNVTRQTETTYASEKMQFSMNAQVNTADGKSINVQLELSMSQEFYSRVDTILAENVKDPLVVNFAASSAALTSTKFYFDIDSDGTSDQISQLGAGSGFLAVDWDGSGSVKDGSQLFGTQSGNGFADLAKHDKDGSGWIDENDEIFDKLRIWTWDDSGESKMLTLGEVGIGAIYVGSANTQYSLQDSGQANGYIRSTGFFLRENGTAGTVQHVDLVV